LPGDVIYVKENKVSKKNHLRTQYCFNRKPFKNLEKHLDKYESLFRKSIKNYVDTVKPENLGIFLSGGHDSSYIFIQSSKVFKKPIHGYTVSFRKFGFDEAPKAEAICKKFGGVHHTIEIGPEHLDMIPRLTSVLEEPLSGHGFAAYVIAEESSGQVDTIFTGDPGDTLWAEYYPVAEWHKYLKYLPYLPRKAIHDISSFLIRITDWERLWELEHTLSLFSRKEMYKDFMQRLCTYRHFNDKNLRRLLAGNTFGKVMKNKCSIDIRFSKNNFSDALIESKMIYGVFVYNILMNQKPVESFGMNFYCPYLDRDIIEFINSLPLNWLNSGSTFEKLINSGTRRRFHKLALLRYLPKRFVYGLQQSFDVPWYLLFHKRQRILENLLKRLKKRGWYNPKYLDKIFREFRTQKIKPHEIIELKHHGYRIYSLLSLEIWCMEFLDSQTTDKNRPLEEYLKL
ncbi:hypothetical protein JXC34_06920, partial [Candidatus Woesearchaeota archaeon]|nr:hypothetical protein [Candidatus Woesearchaeota archaeon]